MHNVFLFVYDKVVRETWRYVKLFDKVLGSAAHTIYQVLVAGSRNNKNISFKARPGAYNSGK